MERGACHDGDVVCEALVEEVGVVFRLARVWVRVKVTVRVKARARARATAGLGLGLGLG